jgi:hypothetical protein
MERQAPSTDDVGMKTITTARRLALETPPDRNRYVDFLRAASILVVVFGHWLMAGPEVLADGSLQVGHLIAEARWAQALTWLLQVMPVFFFVGGYSNAAGWRAARRRGVAYGAWLRDRLRRLVLPVAPLLVVWAVAATVGLGGGLDPELLRLGSQAALVPVWFLATYVLIVMTTPLTLALWERLGWRAFAGLAGAAALVDLANLSFGVPVVEWLNYLFVWNAVHLLGYAWIDGRTTGRRPQVGIAAGGVASLAVLVAALPYPLAMVGLDGAAVANSNPPKFTLIALGMFQYGLAMLFEAPIRRRLEANTAWTAVVAVNGAIMTLYLWHLTAMVAVLGGSLAAGGWGLHLAVDTSAWWATRPLWIGVMVAVTVPFVGLFARFERPAHDRRPAPRAWRPVLAAVAVCAGLGLLARHGVADADGLNGVALTLPLIGVLVGGLAGAGTAHTSPTSTR